MKKLFFLIMAAMLAIPVFGYEIFVVETGEFVQTETIPTVKKAEIRESDQITVTYTFDSLLVVRDSVNPDIVCFQPEGFGLIHWDEHAMTPYKMDQYLLPCNEKGTLESFTTSSVEYGMEYMPSHNDYSDLDSIPVVSPPIRVINQYLPDSPVVKDESQQFRGCEMLRVSLFPVQYNSQIKKVRINKEISYTITKTELIGKDNGSEFANVFSPMAANRQWHLYIGPEPDAVDANQSYLIITTESLKPAAERLKAWKKACGYNCSISILPENSSQIDVKLAINECLSTNPDLYYVLFMGDEIQVPAMVGRYPTFDPIHNTYLNYLTDFPYACLDGENDFIPDLCIGRLPFPSLSEMNRVVEKTIVFEKDPSFNRQKSRATFISYFQDIEGRGIPRNGFVYNTERSFDYALDFFDECFRIYTKPTDAIPMQWSQEYGYETISPHLRNNYMWGGNTEQIITEINNGTNLIFHRDHGVPYGWCQPEFFTQNLVSLHNSISPIVISIDCNVGAYYKENSFAKAFLNLTGKNGCTALIGATNPSNTYRNDALIIGMTNAIWPNPGIKHHGHSFVNVGNNEYFESSSLGEILNQGLLQMEETCYASFFTPEDTTPVDILNNRTRELYHCLGDPSLPIYWDSSTDLSKIAKRHDYPGYTSVVSERDVTVAFYDSICDKSIRMYGKNFRYESSNHPDKVRVTVMKPGCKPAVLPTTVKPYVNPGIIGSIIGNSLDLTLSNNDNDDEFETGGYDIVVNYGDGSSTSIATESDKTDYSVDISDKPGLAPSGFFIVNLRKDNQNINTIKVMR